MVYITDRSFIDESVKVKYIPIKDIRKVVDGKNVCVNIKNEDVRRKVMEAIVNKVYKFCELQFGDVVDDVVYVEHKGDNLVFYKIVSKTLKWV